MGESRFRLQESCGKGSALSVGFRVEESRFEIEGAEPVAGRLSGLRRTITNAVDSLFKLFKSFEG